MPSRCTTLRPTNVAHRNHPPPSPPPDDQKLASDVLADVSLMVGSAMLLMALLCAYLIMSVQIMSWLHRCSNGKLVGCRRHCCQR